MRKFLINVSGMQYEVEVEEVTNTTEAEGVKPTPVQPIPAVKPPVVTQNTVRPKAEAKKTDEARPVPQGAEAVKAPMPGTILDIKVGEGDMVKTGQVLLILEAMKMENEIVAPRNGRVTAIIAVKGASVNAGDLLISLV